MGKAVPLRPRSSQCLQCQHEAGGCIVTCNTTMATVFSQQSFSCPLPGRMGPLAMAHMPVGLGRRESEFIPEVGTITKLCQKGKEWLLASGLQNDRTSRLRKMLKITVASALPVLDSSRTPLPSRCPVPAWIPPLMGPSLPTKIQFSMAWLERGNLSSPSFHQLGLILPVGC